MRHGSGRSNPFALGPLGQEPVVFDSVELWRRSLQSTTLALSTSYGLTRHASIDQSRGHRQDKTRLVSPSWDRP